MELIDMLKVELSIIDNSQDNLLQMYVDKAIKRIADITRRDEVYIMANMSVYIIDIAILLFNRKGSEGLASQGYSGMSESYLNTLPTDLEKAILRHRLIGWQV